MTYLEAAETILKAYLSRWPVPVDRLPRLAGGIIKALREIAPVVAVEDAPVKSTAPPVDDVPPVESAPLPPRPASAGGPIKLEPLPKLQPMAPEDIIKAVRAIEAGQTLGPNRLRPVTPATSVFPTYMICLHCERRLAALSRHLSSAHNQTFEEYRAQFKLPDDYPLRAPDTRIGRPKSAAANWLNP